MTSDTGRVAVRRCETAHATYQRATEKSDRDSEDRIIGVLRSSLVDKRLVKKGQTLPLEALAS